MITRRRGWPALAGLLGLCGLVLSCLVLPAGAQSSVPPPPAIAIDTFRTLRAGGCANPGDNFDLQVGGTTNQFTTVSIVLFSPTGSALTKGTTPPTSGRWLGSVVFNYSFTGTYEIRATVSGVSASAFMEVPCQTPTLDYAPTCFTAGVQTRLRMTGRHFAPYGTGYMDYDIGGSEQQSKIRIQNDGRGVFFADFLVTPSNRDHPGEARNNSSTATATVLANATWSACPPGATTTTSTSTPGSVTTTSTTQPVDTVPVPDETTTSTTKPSNFPGPPVTVPPAIVLPPATAGATLTATPEIGTAGFVTTATGTGFPPGAAVALAWQPGIGHTIATVGGDGTFTAHMLVFPNDRIGPRALVATGGGTTAFDAFLVVESTVQPSGQNVSLITRIRRFNSR